MNDLNDQKIRLALRNRHSGESWVYLDELRTRTGISGRCGYIDAYAIGLWESNIGFTAYEIKISKSDFKHDIDKFVQKQADAIRNSNQFYYVCPHGVVETSEVPDTAGLIWVDAGGAKVKKVAPFRELIGGSLDLRFVMALLRHANGPPQQRSLMLKYLGKDISEDDLLKIADSAGKLYNQRSIDHLVSRAVEAKSSRSHDILIKVCSALGISNYKADYDEIDKLADTIVKELKEKRSEISKVRIISLNAKSIKQAADELERLTNGVDALCN